MTLDLDFGDLLAAGDQWRPSVVLVWTQNARPTSVTPKVLDVVARFGAELATGPLIVVEDARFRLRRLTLL